MSPESKSPLGEQQDMTGRDPSLMESESVSASHIAGLNPAQLKGKQRANRSTCALTSGSTAVKHDPGIPLQILAGPGSGKTKVFFFTSKEHSRL